MDVQSSMSDSHSPEGQPTPEPDIAWLSRSLKRHKSILLSIPSLSAAGSLLLSFFVTPLYTSEASFVPEAKSAISSVSPALMQLASQFGFPIAGQAATGPQFYAEIISSRELRGRILLSRFPTSNSGRDTLPLLDVLGIRGETIERRLEKGNRYLDKHSAVEVDLRTSIIRLAVDAPDKRLSQLIAERFLTELNDFNLERQQSQARLKREFIETRVDAADSALTTVETRLKDFYERNRSWENSPDLRFEEQRLRRRVTIQEELATTLRRDYETARIEEVNDTPVITVIDPPSLPSRHSRPRRAEWLAVAILLGIATSVTISLIAEQRRKAVVNQ